MPPRKPHRRILFLIIFLLAAAALHPQSPPSPAADSVDSIFNLPWPPSDFFWSPDSSAVLYIANDAYHSSHINAGDLVSIDARTMKERVLIPQQELSRYTPADTSLSPIDRDHRNHYSQPPLLWSPDAKSLLLDSAGTLYLYDLAHHRAHAIAAAAASSDNPKFSPDGKFLSYIRDHGLYLHPVAGDIHNHAEIAFAPGDESHRNGEADWVYMEELDVRSNYFWSPDSTRIAYLQSDESRVPVYTFTDEKSHAAIATQRYPQPGSPNPVVRISIAAVANPTHPLQLQLPLSQGNDYIPRFGWLSNTALWIEVLDRDQHRLRLYFADAATGAAACIYTETDPAFLDANYNFTFLPNSQFIRASWRASQSKNQDSHTHLYLYRYDSSALTQPAALVRQLTHGNFDIDTSAPITASPNADRVFFSSNELNPLGREFFSVSLVTGNVTRLSYDQYAAGPQFRANATHVVSLSPDTTAFIDVESAADWSGRVSLNIDGHGPQKRHSFTLDPSQRLFNSFAASASGFSFVFWQHAKSLASPPIPLTLRAADNSTTLYAYLTLPPDKNPRSASIPLLLNPYGGPGVQSVTDAWQAEDTAFTQLLARHGFAVLSVDNRGMAMRGRKFAIATAGNFGALQLADQLAATDQVLARYPQLDGSRLGIFGWSFGGYLATYAATHSTRFRSAVAGGTVTDWHLYDSIFTERYLGPPAANAAAYDSASVLTAAAQLHAHLLLVYGNEDDNVHPINTQQLARALANAHRAFDLQIYPAQTHTFDSITADSDFYTRTLTQFEHDLK